jgi:hypothetical protein
MCQNKIQCLNGGFAIKAAVFLFKKRNMVGVLKSPFLKDTAVS